MRLDTLYAEGVRVNERCEAARALLAEARESLRTRPIPPTALFKAMSSARRPKQQRRIAA